MRTGMETSTERLHSRSTSNMFSVTSTSAATWRSCSRAISHGSRFRWDALASMVANA